jgi:Domain of unknown function (DUF4349)
MKNISQSLSGSLRGISPKRRGLVFFFALFAGLLLIGRFGWRPIPKELHQAGGFREYATLQEEAPDADLKEEWQRMKGPARQMPSAPVAARSESASTSAGGLMEVSSNGGPLIAHAAVLAVTTKDFSHSRSTLEEILERHHGYASKLRMTGQGNGSTLTATLRIPSSEFGSTVTDLKTLGNVQKEEQTADEITQQRADLEARLANAQNSLQRLQEILGKTKPWDNSAEVQRQLINVRAEVTRLQAERIASENRTVFANVLFSMREEIAAPVETFGAQFHKAAQVGISDALGSLSGIVLFLLSYGPAFLTWTLLLLFPSRWMWRKWRPITQTGTAQTVQSA